jgi:hypothetical protein
MRLSFVHSLAGGRVMPAAVAGISFASGEAKAKQK